MIHDFDSSEQTKNALLLSLKTLKVAQLLRRAGIRKNQGAPAFDILKFLILLVFQGKNLYRTLDSERNTSEFSKNTYYRFLNESSYPWRRFLFLFSNQVIQAFKHLTRPTRVNVLILDDSIIPRDRSKAVELLARIHDHTSNRYKKGFSMLTLGWSDGYSFIPINFAMLSSAKEKNRLQEMSSKIDKRSHGYKRRLEAMEHKPDVALKMVQDTLNHGIQADYLLMDSWFTNEPFVMKLKDEGLDSIGMVKDMKQKYGYKGRSYGLKEIRTLVPKNGPSNILGSVIVTTKKGLPIKLVFIKNRNNKREWLAILCTDLSLSDQEIVRIYGNRWSIETFFKSAKSFMKLGSEFQGRSYDMTISHTTIVCIRCILLEWLKREENDERSFGELFYQFCDDIRDMDIVTALQSLMALFVEHTKLTTAKTKAALKCQLQHWIDQQARFVKALFADIGWES